MKWAVRLFIFPILGACMLFTAHAEDVTVTPEPETRADNECYSGGRMAGKCDNGFHADGSVTSDEVAWAWRCGWYMARFNDGTFPRDAVPNDCASLLPGLPPPELSTASSIWVCTVVFGGTIGECLSGNILSTDIGNDGSVDDRYYLITDATSGNGGVCPIGVPFVNDIGYYSFEPPLVNWLYSLGFKATDDVCGPIP